VDTLSAMPTLALALAFLSGCRPYSPPPVQPPIAVASGPLRVEKVAEARPAFSVVVRAGSAYDPPSREGLAFLAANAIALSAPGTKLNFGPELVTFSAEPEAMGALAAALSAPLSENAFTLARSEAYAALRTRDCATVAAEVGETWLFGGHPYGHAQAGRMSTLPTFSLAEVEAFRAARYVRDAVVLGVDGENLTPPDLQNAFAPRLSRSPTPAVHPLAGRPSIVVEARVDRACMFVTPRVLGDESRHSLAARTVAAYALGSPGTVPRVDTFPRMILNLPGDGFAASLSLAAGLDGPVLSVPFEGARDAVRARLLRPAAADRAGERLLSLASRSERVSREQLATEMEAMSAEEFALWAHEALGPGRLSTVVVTPDASAWRRLESSPKPVVLDSEDILR
jgi:hypothetical protein